MMLEEPSGRWARLMPTRTALRGEDPIEGLRTVHLIEDAIVQRGLRQLRFLLQDADGRRLLDEITMSAVGSISELEDIVQAWDRERHGEVAPVPTPPVDRDDVLRSFVDLKESEALVLRRAAREAPEAIRPRLAKLAEKAEDHARRLKQLGG